MLVALDELPLHLELERLVQEWIQHRVTFVVLIFHILDNRFILLAKAFVVEGLDHRLVARGRMVRSLMGLAGRIKGILRGGMLRQTYWLGASQQ